jgi:hypothetical protein
LTVRDALGFSSCDEEADRTGRVAAAGRPVMHDCRKSDSDSGKWDVDMAHNKRVEALRNNPGGDWITADLEITATQFAIKFRKTTRTHVVFLHPSVPNCVSIPMKKKIRPVHVRAFLSMIERMDNVRG